MPKVHIILDSTAHTGATMLAEHQNLHSVPLTLTLGQCQWLEDQITNEELFALVRETGEFPKTSQPAPGDYIRTFLPIIEAGNEIVVIAVSSGLSGTMQSARTAAKCVDPSKIWIIDSGTTAIGMVRLAEKALKMAEDNQSAADIAKQMERLSQATHTLFVPETLEYLHKGGRIGGAATLLGTILQIRPVLHLHGGQVAILDKVRTWSKAVARIVEEVKQHNNPVHIDVVHFAGLVEAQKLYVQLSELYPDVPVSISTGGAVLAAHLGPGLVGVVLQDSI